MRATPAEQRCLAGCECPSPEAAQAEHLHQRHCPHSRARAESWPHADRAPSRMQLVRAAGDKRSGSARCPEVAKSQPWGVSALHREHRFSARGTRWQKVWVFGGKCGKTKVQPKVFPSLSWSPPRHRSVPLARKECQQEGSCTRLAFLSGAFFLRNSRSATPTPLGSLLCVS